MRSAIGCCLLIACEGVIGTTEEPPVVVEPFAGLERCDPAPADQHPLRRHTPAQHLALLQVMFPGVAMDGLRIPVASGSGYDNDATFAAPTSQAVAAYVDAAERVTARVMSDRTWMMCDVAEGECVRETLLSLARTAYRRPLLDDEERAFNDLANDAEWSAEERLAIGIEALLQAPDFIYAGEVGGGGGPRALQSHEIAARLSLFLWNEPADAALRAQAESRNVSSDEGLLSLLDEMLADPRTERGFDHFMAQWFALDAQGADPAAFPGSGYDETTLIDLRRSALAFLRHAFFDASSTDALFTGTHVMINDRLASLFGVAPPGSEELIAVDLEEGPRSGILTHPAVLASTSHPTSRSAVRRGVYVIENLLCRPQQSPPPTVDDTPPQADADAQLTSRQVGERARARGTCGGCHSSIDGIGFTFENFDAIGRFQTAEEGLPIDATGDFGGVPVDGAAELGAQLAREDEVLLCITRQVFRYGMGRRESSADECAIRNLAVDLKESEGDLRGLVRAFVLSDAFRTIPRDECEGECP